jgi:hypothetical protein
MATRLYAVVLHSQSPPELLALVEDYLHVHDSRMKFLLCSNIEPVGTFLHCELVQNETRKLWCIQIPISFVVAIADLSKGQSPPGFLMSDQ